MDHNWVKPLFSYLEYYISNIQNEDQQRINAITPYCEHYKLQDVMHLLQNHLLEIRIYDQIHHLGQINNIKNCSIVFEDTFKNLHFEDKQKKTFPILMVFVELTNKVKNNWRGMRLLSEGVIVYKIGANTLSLQCSLESYMSCTETIKF